MKVVTSDRYHVDIGEHVFPTEKYGMIMAALLDSHVISDSDIHQANEATREQILAVHTADYLRELDSLAVTPRTISSELPLTKPVVDAYKIACGGTILAVDLAISSKTVVSHVGGGFHHAFANHAEGFCYLNDIAVAVRHAQATKGIRRAAVIDVDLHQGNGTAHIFQDDPDVFTFSIHQEELYPKKQPSDLDIGLPNYCPEDKYLAELEMGLNTVFDHKPELIIYVAGADPYKDDQLGQLMVSMEGLRKRDEMVLTRCSHDHIPTVTVTAGGYARHVNDTVEIHKNTVKVAQAITSKPSWQVF